METSVQPQPQNYATKKLPIQHIGAVAEIASDIIHSRKIGEEKSLKTGYKALDEAFLNGME